MKMNIRSISLAILAGAMGSTACVASAYTPLPDGVQLRTNDCNIRLKVVNDKIIRVSATPEKVFPADASLITVPQTAPPRFNLKACGNGGVELTTAEIKATVDGKTGAVTFYDKNGRKVVQENAGGRTFTPITVDGTDG